MSDELEVFFLAPPPLRLRPRDSARVIEPNLFRDDDPGCPRHGKGDDVICGCASRPR